VLLALLLFQFLCLFRPDALAWDGAFYYAYTRSTVCDGDLRLGNDLVLLYKARDDPYFRKARFESVLTSTGRVDNPFAIGVSLLWLPWFVMAHALISLLGWVGAGPSRFVCYEWPFVWGMATVTCVYGWLGVVIGFHLAKKLVSEWVALVASAVTMFVTPLLYYQFREPFYAHAASAMTTALFVYAWWCFAERADERIGQAFLLGFLAGLAALVRSQNIVYVVLPIWTLFFSCLSFVRRRDWRGVGRVLLWLFVFGVSLVLVLTLQFSVWYVF
jgi:hypothetical protein